MLVSACSMLFPAPSITVLGDGRKNFYPAGEAVNIPAGDNTNGLYVTTPQMMEYMMLNAAGK